MTPADYCNIVISPTLREFLAARGDRRLAYLSAISTYQLIDYIAVDAQITKGNIFQDLKFCKPALDVVQGIANGTKHAKDAASFKHAPGSEREVPAFAFDVPGAGWGQGRWDVPGLAVDSDGNEVFIDGSIQAVLKTMQVVYPAQLQTVDFSYFDPQFRP